MPSAFETAFAANLSGLYAQFGVSASYTAPDGTSTSGLTVRVIRHDAHQVERPTRAVGELQTGEVLVQQSALAKPLKGGRFTVEGREVWTIEVTPTLKNGEHICTVSRAGVERLMDRRAKE